jgi:hypothetical protein
MLTRRALVHRADRARIDRQLHNFANVFRRPLASIEPSLRRSSLIAPRPRAGAAVAAVEGGSMRVVPGRESPSG